MTSTTQPTTPTPATKRPRRLTDEQRGERQRERFDERFIAAARTMENRTRRIGAFVIVDPKAPDRWGRVVITKGAGGSVLAVAWMPDEAGRYNGRHTAKAHGGGFDKATAAMAGARFIAPDGAVGRIEDSSKTWDRQLQDAGFIVIQAC